MARTVFSFFLVLIHSSLAIAEDNYFDPSIKISLTFSGVEQDGYLAYLGHDCLVLHTFGGPQSIPTALIERISYDGTTLSGEALGEWVTRLQLEQQNTAEEQQGYQIALKQAQLWTVVSPPMGTLRMAREDNDVTRADWLGLATFDSLLIGGTLYGIYGAKHWGIVAPFGLSLILYRIWAVKDIQIGYSTNDLVRTQMEARCRSL